MNPNDTDASLESLLSGLPLRMPSDDLDARVDATFAKFQPHRPRRLRLYPFALAASVLIAIGIGMHLAVPKVHRPQLAAARISHPIQIERLTSTVYDDGVITSTDDAAYHQFRRRTVREIWYVDPATHAKLQVSIPTVQVLIQKVDAY